MSTSPRILLVEDDAILIIDLQETLTRLGYQVIGLAATGPDAVQAALTAQPDAILMDINLRGPLNGIQAARQIRQQLEVPVIYLTAYTDDDLLDQAKTTDAYAYLVKPVRDRELRASLEMALYKHASERRVQQLNQVLRAVRDVNQLITREQDPQRLLFEAGQILRRTRGYRAVWIGRPADGRLQPATDAGEVQPLLDRILSTGTPEQFHALPGTEAARTRQVVLCPDMPGDPRYAPWQALVRELRLGSTIAIPMLHAGHLAGVLVVYAEEVNRFDLEEIDLLLELAGDVAFGLKAIAEEAERRQAEQALRAREALFHAVVDWSWDGVVMLDRDRRVKYASPSYVRLTGYAAESLVGQAGADFVHPEDQAETARVFNLIRQTPGARHTLDYRLRHRDGHWLWLETTATNLLEEPQVQAVVINSRDITGRRQTEAALRRRNAELTALNQIGQALSQLAAPVQLLEKVFGEIGRVLDNRNLFIALYEAATQVITFPIYTIHGERLTDRRRPLGNGLTDYVIRTNAPLLIQRDLAATLRARGIDLIGALSRSFLAVPLRAADRVIGVIAVQDYEAEDAFDEHALELLTTVAAQAASALENARLFQAVEQELEERRRAEAALQQSQEQFQAVVQTAHDAIVTIDAQQAVTLWNAAAERLFGYTAAEMLGQPVTRIVPAQFRAQNQAAMERVFSGGVRHANGYTLEAAGLNRAGAEFPVEMSLAEWHTPAGVHVTAVIRDIRERKQAEALIRRSERNYRELFQVNKDGIALLLPDPASGAMRFVELNEAAHQMLDYTRAEMLALTPAQLEVDVSAETLRARQAALEAHGVAEFETALRHRSGRRVPAEFTAQMIQYEDQPAVMNIIRDITERRQHEQELQAIASLSAALRAAPTRALMLPVVVEQLRGLLSGETLSIEIIDPAAHEAVLEAAYGVQPAPIGRRQPAAAGRNAVLAATRRPYLDNNAALNVPVPPESPEPLPAAAGVPLIAQETLIGYLWVGRTAAFSAGEIQLLAAVADIAASAIHRATLHEAALQAAADLVAAYDTTLEGWAHALELRDQETEGHAQRVTAMTLRLAAALGFSGPDLMHLRRGALLHDIGKMGVPDAILRKPGPLTEAEWAVMRRHPQLAYDMLAPIEFLRPALEIPYCHHERWDGAGYPRGLQGEQIPRAARVFAVVDVWDALISDRPYRPAWSRRAAREHLRRQAGAHFDPAVIPVFLDLEEQLAARAGGTA